MGRAARWLRRIFGGKRSDPEAKARAREEEEEEEERRRRRRWGLGKSFRESRVEVRRPRWAPPPPPPPPTRTRLRARAERGGGEEEESKRAIAVAAATAAVAEAAVAAAQAAAAVVKLTSAGSRCVSGELRRAAAGAGGGFRRRECAAVRIQAAFRGYLARKALRALRGLVKLQALVRGNIVRKQAAETLRCMHALVRVQARARACRALRAQSSGPCAHPGHPTPEKRDHNVQTNMPKSDRFGSLKSLNTEATDQNSSSHSSGWNWLDRWMEDRYWNIHEPATKSGLSTTMDDEKNAKILEVDPGKPQFSNNSKKSRGFTAAAAAAADSDSTTTQLSIPSPSTGEVMQPLCSLRFAAADLEDEFGECPQFYSATSQQGRGGPFTPSKGCFGSYLDYPNYMANTESSKAKARSQSAPKQRPECYEKSGLIKRVGQVSGLSSAGSGSGCGYVAGQQQNQDSAASGPQKSLHAKFANKAYPGSGRLDRLGMPIRY